MINTPQYDPTIRVVDFDMELTFYGGVNEIGGNKFLLKHKNTAVFLDFGKSFNRENKYFDFPLLRPFFIQDLKKIQAIPEIKGLYRDSHEDSEVDCILLTHPHVDHFGYISLLNSNVLVHLGEGAKTIIDIRSEIYRVGWDRKLDHITFETFRTGDERQMGDFVYTPYSVDHSVPSSYGFIIRAGDKTVLYTGDLRRHGTMKHLTEQLLRAAKKENVDVMLCEGTNITQQTEDVFLKGFEHEFMRRMGKIAPERVERQCKTEADVEREMKRLVDDLDGLIIVETCPADIDRIRTIWNVSKATGRKLILDSRQAYLTYELDKRDPKVNDLPCAKDSYVYFNRIRDRDAEIEGTEAQKKWRPKFQQDLMETCDQIRMGFEGREEVRRDASEYIFCTDNASHKLLELLEDKPFKCNFVLSKSEPFNEEMVISFDRLLHWLASYQIKQYHQIHVSGHCGKTDLVNIVEEVNPDVLIPIHTENPKLLARFVEEEIQEIKIPAFQEKIIV